jgi:Protein of unknown function (DUF3168)
MSAETAFRARLVAYGPLAALVGDRVVQNGIAEGAPVPYVIFTTNHDETRGLDGTLLADEVTISAECWGASALEADAVADQVQAALGSGSAVLSRANGFDADQGLDATVLSIDWWQ